MTEQALAIKYSPNLYYHEDEVCFPISINQYLSKCELIQNTSTIGTPNLDQSIVLQSSPTQNDLYKLYTTTGGQSD
jgi:hypothetical protein